VTRQEQELLVSERCAALAMLVAHSG
jgi:hypothetical protein